MEEVCMIVLWQMLKFIQALTWVAAWSGPLTILYKLTGHAMGRETVYRCCDFSEILKHWEDEVVSYLSSNRQNLLPIMYTIKSVRISVCIPFGHDK